MITIVDLEAVNRYRERRENRIARADEGWITVNGTHILVGDDDEVLLGPDELKKPDLKVGKEMKPINSDYDYEDGDDEEDFTRKNIDKLKKIYDESGINAVHDEWYRFRMENSTKGLHQISKDDADEVMYDNVRQSIYDGWFRNADSSYKPKLVDAVIGSPEVRNAALNLAYENYKEVGKMEGKKPLSFEEFLTTPIKMYRGENGQRHLEDDVFDAYTFDRKMAEHFASKPGRGESKVIEIEVRPIDTYGSMRVVGESEIWVPRELSPVGYKHGDRMDESHRYNPVLWAFEDYEEPVDDSVDILDSIIRDAEMVKLFADNGEETGKKILARCFDGIQKSVLQLTARKVKDTNNDSAFFEGELNSNLGEREVLYPEIEAFKERRRKRMDAKDEDVDWITVNGNHIPVDDERNPIGGQEKALGGDGEVSKTPELKKSWKKAFESGKKYAEQYGNEREALWSMGMDEMEEFFSDDDSPAHLFWHAGFIGREPEWVEAIRYGEIPKSGYSMNYAEGKREPGVSCVKIIRNPEDEDYQSIYDVTLGDRKLIKVGGWYIGGSGSDGEPVLIGAKKIGDVSGERRKDRVDSKEPDDWITVNGNHIPVDKDGKPVGGQKKALGSGKAGVSPKKMSKADAERISADYMGASRRLKKSKEDLSSSEWNAKHLKSNIEFAEEEWIPNLEFRYKQAKKVWDKIKSGKTRKELEDEEKSINDKALSENIFINSLRGKPPSEDSLDRKRWEKAILENAEEVTGTKMPEQGTDEYEDWKHAMLGTFSHDIGSAVAKKMTKSLMDEFDKMREIKKELGAMDDVDAAKVELDSEKSKMREARKKLAGFDREAENLRRSIEEDTKKLSDGADEWKNAVNMRFPTYDDCATADDVAEKLWANGCVSHDSKIDFNRIPVESAKMVGGAIDEFFQKIPAMKGKLGGVSTADLEAGAYAGSVSGAFGDSIYLDTDEDSFGGLGKLRDRLQRDVKKKYHPDGVGTDFVLKHELSHKMDSYLTRMLKGDAEGDDCKDISTLVLEEVSKKLDMDEEDVKAEVSGYARKRACGDWDIISPKRNLERQGHFSGKNLEFFAEAMGEYLSCPNPRRIAVAVWEATQKYLKQAEELGRKNVRGLPNVRGSTIVLGV